MDKAMQAALIADGEKLKALTGEDHGPRFISPCMPPEGRDRELLTVLAEECAVVQQRICKALRFGLEEVQPGQPHNNAFRIGLELGDLLEVVDRCLELDLIPVGSINQGRANKVKQLAKFLQNA